MRLGEIKQILDRVVTDNSTIKLENEAQYGGQAQLIKNYGDAISALDCIIGQTWSGIDVNTLKTLEEKYSKSMSLLMSQEDFNKLNSMINTANQKLPIYYSILETMVDDQNEHSINIKLPSGINSLSDLSKANKKIEDVLKFYNVDGQFNFVEFDKGTKWYVVVAMGTLSYHFIINGLDIAQKYFETRKAYTESKMAELDYRAAVDKETITKQEVIDFIDRKLKLLVEQEVKEAIEKIGTGSNSAEELEVKLIKATTALIKELDEGTEFHLSLNPPQYANESEGRISIDYTQIRPLITAQEEVKQIGSAKKEEVEDEK